jgi:hypothetical protein
MLGRPLTGTKWTMAFVIGLPLYVKVPETGTTPDVPQPAREIATTNEKPRTEIVRFIFRGLLHEKGIDSHGECGFAVAVMSGR